ncbi:hypothetical protein METBIDRAFT_107435 [Metschnikowia bicuspidata var. bicuspidata NRRL YB-4993]|uniref:Uncharacterized protein n=1 Tax=Metschnikowia bicuspidata var. bicuspidata NRRL YB-4993 TaxID=869754 RepID=A0A1A0HHR0_9ASCO|nr:hypothetical protein METBIDRAFT_107435 [Metschnikowia bicuspidata var. bicuspidata NRRL YB-4993]OBA23541.1 hypothetical protein METBIDRAFT_107435 [Metschnikowia bicuspidata var. bicuspidata NRRL YB-4993]
MLILPSCLRPEKCRGGPVNTYMPQSHLFIFNSPAGPKAGLSFEMVHMSSLTIQRRLALSLHTDDTLYKDLKKNYSSG